MFSAAITSVLSPEKSCTTSSSELTVATETRSAGDISVFTYFCADSTDRCTSSGCIELVSKSRTISRRPATSSDRSGLSSAVTGESGTEEARLTPASPLTQ